MNSLFKFPKSYTAHLIYVLLIPAFFIIFSFLYNPYGMEDFLEVGGKNYAFHLVMLTCIMLCVMALSRLIFYALNKHIDFLWWHYMLWCFGEIVVSSFFMALYVALFYGPQMLYFTALSHCFKFAFSILIYPYIILTLIRICMNYAEESNSASTNPGDDVLAKFYDEHHKLKLTISTDAVLFVSAEANYINVHYLENDRAKEFTIRNSMKSVEPLAEKCGFVRCHRSYYVNPRHVKLLSRGKEGVIMAELKLSGLNSIPVSKQYYDKLSNLL